jgi:hypothetical protein
VKQNIRRAKVSWKITVDGWQPVILPQGVGFKPFNGESDIAFGTEEEALHTVAELRMRRIKVTDPIKEVLQ